MQNTAETMSAHGFSQYELTNYLLQNLYKWDLTPNTKLVLLELSTFYNPVKRDFYPKQKTIASRLGISESSVIRAISQLHKQGLIISERKYTNRYKFTNKIDFSTSGKTFLRNKEMTVEKTQIDSKQHSNLQPVYKEPIREQKKEPISQEDKILYAYAEKRGVKYIKAYVEKLKSTGSAKKIIKEHNKKLANERYWNQRYVDTQEYIKTQREAQKHATNPQNCIMLQEVLKKLKRL